jgi:hypothetical protein
MRKLFLLILLIAGITTEAFAFGDSANTVVAASNSVVIIRDSAGFDITVSFQQGYLFKNGDKITLRAASDTTRTYTLFDNAGHVGVYLEVD